MPIALTTPLAFGPEMFPALKKFTPFIQSSGSCSDQVLFIPGGQPYASGNEYWIETTFYTGRITFESPCFEANQRASDPAVKWIIASNENSEKCLSKEMQARFRYRMKFGNLQLLSTYPLATHQGIWDLTPLERELKPVIDCQSEEFPHDRYHAY
jgi:hypothetical protein